MERGVTITKDSGDFLERFGIWVLLVLALTLRLVYNSGISSTDDLAIAKAALQLLESGPYIPTGHYNARLAMIYPLAGIFHLFGTGEWQMAILPLAASLLSILLCFLIARRLFSWQVGLISAAVLAVFPLDVMFASRFVPDAYFSFMMTVAIWGALNAYDARKVSVLNPWAWLAGLFWGIGYLVKVEAFFLLFPLLWLAWQNRDQWKVSLAIAAGCFVFVGGENIIYWFETGTMLHRLDAIGATSAITWSQEYSGTQLWVFPKSWFVTPYMFGFHYYLFFVSMIWFFKERDHRMTVIMIWAGAFLLWLQFGFNPFEKTPSFKSHLARYCVDLGVPMAILIGGFMYSLFCWRPRAITVFGGIAVLASVMLMQFNVLSNEREFASKEALAQVRVEAGTMVYMDSATYGLAKFLYRGKPLADQAQLFQFHDYDIGKTRLLSVDEIDGVLMVNREFVRHRKNRYFMAGLDMGAVAKQCQLINTVDNPAPTLSYQVARIIRGVLTLLPIEALRSKAEQTVGTLLEGEDVLVYDCTRPR